MGEDAGTTLNSEEQGGARTEEEEDEGRALTGEGERCLKLGLKAEEGAVVRSESCPGGAVGGGLSTRFSKEGLEGGRLVVGDRESWWFGSLEQVLDRARLPCVAGRSSGLRLVNVGRQSAVSVTV